MLLEELHLAFVLPCFFKRRKRPQIAPLAGRFTLLTRVQTIFAGFEFADHMHMDAEDGRAAPRRTRDQNRVRILNERCRWTSNLTRVTPRVTSRLPGGNVYVSNHLQLSFSTKG